MGFSVFPSWGEGFLAHIVFNVNQLDSNLVHLFNLSKKVTIFFVKMDPSFSCYDVINFENFRKDRIWTSSK